MQTTYTEQSYENSVIELTKEAQQVNDKLARYKLK